MGKAEFDEDIFHLLPNGYKSSKGPQVTSSASESNCNAFNDMSDKWNSNQLHIRETYLGFAKEEKNRATQADCTHVASAFYHNIARTFISNILFALVTGDIPPQPSCTILKCRY